MQTTCLSDAHDFLSNCETMVPTVSVLHQLFV